MAAKKKITDDENLIPESGTSSDSPMNEKPAAARKRSKTAASGEQEKANPELTAEASPAPTRSRRKKSDTPADPESDADKFGPTKSPRKRTSRKKADDSNAADSISAAAKEPDNTADNHEEKSSSSEPVKAASGDTTEILDAQVSASDESAESESDITAADSGEAQTDETSEPLHLEPFTPENISAWEFNISDENKESEEKPLILKRKKGTIIKNESIVNNVHAAKSPEVPEASDSVEPQADSASEEPKSEPLTPEAISEWKFDFPSDNKESDVPRLVLKRKKGIIKKNEPEAAAPAPAPEISDDGMPVSGNAPAFVPRDIPSASVDSERFAQFSHSNEPVEEEDPQAAEARSFFEHLEAPIHKLLSTSDDIEEIRQFHIEHHISNLVELFVNWARALEMIDKQPRGGLENLTLAECFKQRFTKILYSDFEAAEEQGVKLPDASIQNRFFLDDLDMLILWLLACDQLDADFKLAIRTTWNQQTIAFMNTAEILRFLAPYAASRTELIKRLSPSSPMAQSKLIIHNPSSVPGQPLYYEIIISEQLVRQFSGIFSLSVSSTKFAELQFPHFSDNMFVAPEYDKTLAIIQNFISRPSLNLLPNLERENLNFSPSLGFTIEGLAGSGRATLIKLVASALKLPVIIVQCSPLTALHSSDVEDYIKNVFIDATLMNAIICLRDSGPMLSEEKNASIFARQLAIHPAICAFCIDLAVKIHPVVEPYITFKGKMEANLRENASTLWTQHLALPGLDTHNVDVHALSERMALQPFQIQKAAKLAYYSTGDLNEAISNQVLEKSAAKQVSKNIGNLAFVTDPEIDLSDVIVSEDIMTSIRKIIGSAKNRRRVLYEWGLSKRIRRGTGVIALFDGDPGTGKTHSAEAIAHELGLSLMRINIATMVDKYIGETEKNLTTIFEQARPDMQLLLFDEADSLFTKRTSNVSKSNDRYSNMSVNVLLQLVERYEGVSILTTNLKNAIDPAFERRITYKVYFPMPKKKERERLWKYMCPPEILTAEPIDYEWLSELEMSGGEIKNAVLTAAFNAATNGVLLNSEYLYDAGVAEASAAGRVMRRYDSNNDGFN